MFLPDLTGKVALVVGATSGIGKGIAYVFAALKANVAIVARNEMLGNQVVADLRRINPNGTYEMIMCDASSMKSIRGACAEYNKKFDKLNYCVMSPGIATIDGRNETSEGIDKKMALHYYGRVMFVTELAPVLRKTAETEDVRVASILSGGVHSPIASLDDLPLKQTYSLQNAANAAGFYNDLGFDQLSIDFSGPTGGRMSFIHTCPGFVKTNWGSDFPWYLRHAVRALQFFAKDPQDYGRVMISSMLGTHMGPPAPPSGELNQAAGFHLMSPTGAEAKRTALHTDLYRKAIWKHTQETLAEALK
ncbi:FabG domain-containing protein [Ochromonadaceae sp. CCMP2298]|nr:FabG domain-containing protein [Ochromonadaceae sp. CCMP2298]